MRWIPFILVVTFAARAHVANACAICGCGDPTLTLSGVEKPLADRKRLGLETRALSDESGDERTGMTTLNEQRLLFTAAYAPSSRVLFTAVIPVVRRQLEYPNLARRTAYGMGDVDLRARLFIYQDRSFSPRHVLAAQLGVVLPTAWALTVPLRGKRPDSDLIAGTQAVTPVVGFTYGFFKRPWSVYVNSTLQVPVAFLSSLRVGPQWQGAVTAQLQPTGMLALRLGAEARWTPVIREDHADLPDTGGTVFYAAPELVFSPIEDFLWYAGVRIPVVNRLFGQQQPGPIVSMGVIRDL